MESKVKMTPPARLSFARELAAQAWCTRENETKEMDADLAEAFAQILLREAFSANLGMATTGELLNELSARCEIHGGLTYAPCNDLDADRPKTGACWVCARVTGQGDGRFWLCLDCQKRLVKQKDADTVRGATREEKTP